MKKIEKRIETPRVSFTAKIEFENKEEAAEHGWGEHFRHEGVIILTKNNQVGDIIIDSRYMKMMQMNNDPAFKLY